MENIVAESLSPVEAHNTAQDSLHEHVKGIENDLQWIIRLLFILTAGMLALLVLVYEMRGTLQAIQASVAN
ncbi:MAG: hypothetical protein F4X02_04250 [Chloroflexi bacterium]|nr:hypothetical protein [Chloroflexota bacterium]